MDRTNAQLIDAHLIDAQLIHDHLHGSPSALSTLIHRHVNLVYAAALRHTRDAALADDVTQAVFLVLTKKARRLRSHTTVAGWLIVVTRHVAKNAIRARTRRHYHERAAARPEIIPMNTSAAEKLELSDILDDALSRLRAADRDTIALRYLQAHTLSEVGQTLGITEEAARKRLTRALSRLHQSLADRGPSLPAAAMPTTIAAFAAPPAPPATVAAAIATSKAPASASIVSLSKGTLHMFALKEIAQVFTIILLGLSAIAGVTVLAQSPPLATPLPAATLAAPPEPPSTSPPLTINTIALQLAVTDIEANIDFFKKVGFRIRWMDKPDANGRLVRATVDSGSIRIRMYRVPAAPHPAKNLIPYFWIDGGSPAIAALHNQLASRAIKVGRLDNSMQLLSFNMITPDGYTMGFYTQP